MCCHTLLFLIDLAAILALFPWITTGGRICACRNHWPPVSPACVQQRHVELEPAVALEERFFKIGKIRYVRTCT